MQQLIETLSALMLPQEAYHHQIENHVMMTEFIDVIDCLKRADILSKENLLKIVHLPKLDVLLTSLRLLEEAGLLTQVYLNLVSAQANFYLALVFAGLKKAKILTPENQDLVIQQMNNEALLLVWTCLKYAGILNQENFHAVSRFSKIKYLAHLLKEFTKNKLLTQDLLNMLLAHKTIDEILAMVVWLQKSSLATKQHYAMVLRHPQHDYLKKVLECLYLHELMTADNLLLVVHHKQLEHLTKTLLFLEKAGILSQKHLNIFHHVDNFEDLLGSLWCLSMRDLLTESNFTMITPYLGTKQFHWMLHRLFDMGGLSQENFDMVFRAPKPYLLGNIMRALEAAKICTHDNLMRFLAVEDIEGLSVVLDALLNVSLLTQENFIAIIEHRDPQFLQYVVDALIDYLADNELLTQENFSLLLTHPRPDLLAEGICELFQSKLLTWENLISIQSYPYPQDLAKTLGILQLAGLLTTENQRKLSALTMRDDLTTAMSFLFNAHLLTQDNLNELILPEHQVLLSEFAYHTVWFQLPLHLFAEAQFRRLLIAAEHFNPAEELMRVMANILHLESPLPSLFNDGQSTHVASVHRSVSEAIEKLKLAYGRGLILEETLAQLKSFVDGLPPSLQHDAAKRGLSRLLSMTDMLGSDTSLPQLLAFIYVALHDEEKRIGHLDDAKSMLVDGLFEIQRGYNLSALGIDDGGSDLPICVAGSYNKLIEKLNGVHRDIEVSIITRQAASMKFPRLAEAHARDYLYHLASPRTAAEAHAMKKLLHVMERHHTLEPIWDRIKGTVSSVLWEEYQEAFQGVAGQRDFVKFIESGIYIPLTDLSSIWLILEKSPGYQSYVRQQQISLSIQTFGLFAGLEQQSEDEVAKHKRPRASTDG